ncbi:homocysteine S-methyltransferase family protein [Leucobacter denitrificans]|uniref:Homocysteine S-methyltransferase family protein n=1 Tax=Leucobacter denitrificans TaxID=683042 RepID=A0A7G9S6V3_9MICO|nr:homocysteine S-methyltransferase family protein [Leucobacter denitrificans]QNN63578.1 homocysteine S-methyltransferase family protein [Leucobacter denitrificans]
MTTVFDTPVLGDGGIETALEDRLGQELPEFAAFVLLDTEAGRESLREYYRPYLELTERDSLPMLLDTPTWRANPDWIALVDGEEDPQHTRLNTLNTDAVTLLREYVLRVAPNAQIEINGVVGPRFDDYEASQRMSAEEAEAYHGPQVRALADAGADRVTSVTTLDAAEGLGVVRAALAATIPVVVSFTVGADGKLADGSSIVEAIREVDEHSDRGAIGFAVNCAHPSEVLRGVDPHAPETARIIGVRLNAARDGEDGPGDEPAAFSDAMIELARHIPSLQVFGGCCGTDTPHISAVAGALRASS